MGVFPENPEREATWEVFNQCIYPPLRRPSVGEICSFRFSLPGRSNKQLTEKKKIERKENENFGFELQNFALGAGLDHLLVQ